MSMSRSSSDSTCASDPSVERARVRVGAMCFGWVGGMVERGSVLEIDSEACPCPVRRLRLVIVGSRRWVRVIGSGSGSGSESERVDDVWRGLVWIVSVIGRLTGSTGSTGSVWSVWYI